MTTIPQPVSLDQETYNIEHWTGMCRIFREKGHKPAPFRKVRTAAKLMEEGGKLAAVAERLGVEPMWLLFSLHEYSDRLGLGDKLVGLEKAGLQELPPYREMTPEEFARIARRNVEEYRARLAAEGKSLLTEEELAPLWERVRQGESMSSVEASLGLPANILFVSWSDCDLRRQGF